MKISAIWVLIVSAIGANAVYADANGCEVVSEDVGVFVQVNNRLVPIPATHFISSVDSIEVEWGEIYQISALPLVPDPEAFGLVVIRNATNTDDFSESDWISVVEQGQPASSYADIVEGYDIEVQSFSSQPTIKRAVYQDRFLHVQVLGEDACEELKGILVGIRRL